MQQNSEHQLVKLDGVRIHKVVQLSNDKGWIELGYEEGALEFTIVQMTFHGDWRIGTTELQSVFEFAINELEIG